VLLYNVLLLCLVLGVLLLLWRTDPRRAAPLVALCEMLLGGASICGAIAVPAAGFGRLALLAWALFVHQPLLLAGIAILRVKRERLLAGGCALLALAILLVGADAFLIEPHWLQVTHVTIPSTKLQTPLRVAVIADLQTDAPRVYEERALALAMAKQPDLILLAGDYLHIADPAEYATAKEALNEILRRADLTAPLGVYAIQGNVDHGDWEELFAGLPVTPIAQTSALDLGPVVLTGLSLHDAFSTTLSIPPKPKLHIVLGHSPDFALGEINADLLIAGHTHGGQIQLPFLGPIMTLSHVPRSWASGVTEIAPGRTLIVSRGIGMERGGAPRVRFLCRPEIVILDLVPLSD